ncbi:MAG: hypothetical protein IKX85_05515, partial [Clostridia bacterium]|nr:hypothetical protein [Clostridia bacterium]
MDGSEKNALRTLLVSHAKRYPATFGPGHMVESEEAALARLSEERAAKETRPVPFREELGEDFTRLNLDSREGREVPDAILARLFFLSAKAETGTREEFLEKLLFLEELAREEIFAFSGEYFSEALEAYRAAGLPPLHHSDAYRKAYRPSYRVVSAPLARLLPLILRIEALFREKERLLVVLDGRCAGGKSTAAELLAAFYPASATVHMDDFFLPLALRTPERYAEPGGNVHYERFREEVAPHAGKESFSYRVFDCRTFDYGGERKVPLAPLTVVEGSYSGNPKLGLHPDLRVFFTVDPETQLKRIEKRNGPEKKKLFIAKWIPLEEAY